MNAIRTISYGLAIAFALSIAACGGGGGGDSTPSASVPPPAAPPPTGGIDRGGVAVGAITGFGSIFVNGVEFETDDASITADDDPATEAELEIGQIVTVVGTINDDGVTGTAEQVTFDDNVEGPISTIDVAASRLVVLGQTVIVDDTTIYDDSIPTQSLAGLNVGDTIEVSGFVDADGSVRASYIELKPAGGELEVRGIVSALDSATSRFNINDLVVDYSAAMLEDFPGGTIGNGDPVEAKGTSFGAQGELLATRVEYEDDAFEVEDGDEAEIEGLITRFVSAEDFDVAGRPVTTSAQTVFENGTANDLGPNVKVEAEGAFDANGVLVARKVSIRLASNVRIEAPVQAIDVEAGTFTVLGIVVTVAPTTSFEDDSDAEQPTLDLASLNVGDYVEVRGAEEPPASGAVLASRVEREDPDDEVALQGAVETVAEPDLVILGVTVQTDAGTEFEDANDTPVSSASFFADVTPGTVVKAKGQDLGGTIAAEEVEIEIED